MIWVRRSDGLVLNLGLARIMADDRERGGVICWGWCGPICERCYFIPNTSVRKLAALQRQVATGCSGPTLHEDWVETAYVFPTADGATR